MKVDKRFLTENGSEIFTGNELLVKGALETDGGVHLLGGYPGSPVAGYFDTIMHIKDLLGSKGIHAVINNNEALAAAMLNGTQTLPARAMIVIKSVGAHVAADALALGNLAGAHPQGGAVLVYGDDPWSDSTQVPADSRFISKHLFIPTLEPSNPQEVKDFVDLSFKLSARSELFAGFILTTNLADGGGTVHCRANQYPEDFNTLRKLDLITSRIQLNKRVLLPPKTWWQEDALARRFERAITAARELGLNRIEYPSSGGRKPIGFVSAGLGHDYLVHALYEMGLLGEFPILKFGMSYPVDGGLIEELADQCERIVVVEERRGFMEEQIAEILIRGRQSGGPLSDVELWGKQFPEGLAGIPDTRGLHPSMLISLLTPLVEKVASGALDGEQRRRLQREQADLEKTERIEVDKLPIRLPSFCPGCPHRDSAGLCLDIKRKFADPNYMRKHHHREPVDMIFHGDTGCYTMLMYPPNTDLMHDYSGMGLGGGTGTGTDRFTSNKEVVFMGDGTFYHSGQIAISQAIYHRQDITFIILDNSTTAMTGHQPNPGVDYDILGNLSPNQRIEDIVRGLGSGANVPVYRVDPEKRQEYRNLLEEVFLQEGVKVIIADKECGITRTRRRRREERAVTREKGFLPVKKYMNVNTDICRFCLACSEITGCPGLRHVMTDYGPKMDTDVSWCVSDGACERLGACDSFEQVTVKRKRPPKTRVPELGLDNIPEPRKRPAGELWRCCLTGVGGMGIGLATSILVRAGHYEGHQVIFLDKKGLAIRNGGVVSQVAYNITDKPITALIPFGKADLLLGVDILEAARTLDPTGRFRVADRQKTAAVLNTDKISTIAGLMGREDYDPDELVEFVRAHTREEDFLARNISRICEKYLGSKVYANIMMLGFAFQKGLIPVSMHSIAWAIKDAIRVDFRKNLYAFNMGRKLVEKQDLFQGPPQRLGWRETLEEKCRFAQRRFGRNHPKVETLRATIAETIEQMPGLDEALQRDVVIRAYDAMRWGGVDYAKRYCSAVMDVYRKDRSEYGYAATRAVIHNLASAMLIKDTLFKAELATSPEKYARDREKYGINPARGDRIRYTHLWKRRIGLGPWKTTWTWKPSDRTLQLLKRMKFLRPLLAPWTRRERVFRKRYEARVAEFDYASADEYRRRVAQLGSPMCMDCLSPSCSLEGCPLGADIPEWMKLVDEGKWQAACDLLHRKNNFPEFTAEICPAFCEQNCHRAQQGYSANVRATEGDIVRRGFEQDWIRPQPPKTRSGRKVAIVGSGPAGLAAAQQLARNGHEVHVFEKDSAPGGLLRFGIPEFRLPGGMIDRRVEQLEAEGVTFHCDTQAGRDIGGRSLREDYDAVLLALGAHKPRDLRVPGREKPGVLFAMDYLRRNNGETSPAGAGEYASARDKVVAVIGGGLTGEDCVETALMQGAKEVHQLEILPRGQAAVDLVPQEAPATVRRHFAIATKQFVGEDGGLHKLKAVRVKYTPTATGPKMEEVPESEHHIPADLAILAMGFDPQVDAELVEQLGLAADAEGRIVVNEQYDTNVPGVYAAGDLVTGPSYVATAIASGRAAAGQIERYLHT